MGKTVVQLRKQENDCFRLQYNLVVTSKLIFEWDMADVILTLRFINCVKFNFGKSYFSWDSHTNTVRASLHGGRVPRLTGLPGEGQLLMFLSKTHRSVYMLDRVSRLLGAPCLLARGTRLGGVACYHVNCWCRAIPANRGEINREFFCS